MNKKLLLRKFSNEALRLAGVENNVNRTQHNDSFKKRRYQKEKKKRNQKRKNHSSEAKTKTNNQLQEFTAK